MYTNNNYYFWKFILQSYPFCIGLQLAMIYWEGHRWYSRIRSSGWNEIKNVFWFFGFLYIVVPVGAECFNASWIILLYNEIFSKLRHSKDFDEDLKDSLVGWLNKDKGDLLIKICCINHVKLFSGNGEEKLLKYLEKHHRSGNHFYRNVSWNGIRNYSDKLRKINLMQTIRKHIWRFYSLYRILNNVGSSWDNFRDNRTMADAWE
eukprot:386780_1